MSKTTTQQSIGRTRLCKPHTGHVFLIALCWACDTGTPYGVGARPIAADVEGRPVAADPSRVSDGGGSPREPTSSDDWISIGHDVSNTRHNRREHLLTTANVGSLVEKWRFKPDATCVTSTPAVYEGSVYFGDWNGHLHALNARDGTLIWSTRVQEPIGLSLTSPLTGSPFVSADRVYIGGNAAQMFAVDRKSGRSLWTQPIIIDETDFDSARIFSSAAVSDGLLVIGNASYEVFVANNFTAPLFGFGGPYTFRGSVVGLDALTGALRWRTYLTPEWTYGISVWSSAAIDPARGLAFIGTGQSYTEPASKLADALIALRLDDGAIAWSQQFTPDDAWSLGGTQKFDQDVGASPNLFESDGVALVGVGDKGGGYHVLSRDTGKLVWQRRLTAGSHLGGVMGTAAYADGQIFVASNHGVSGFLTEEPRAMADIEHSYPTSATVFALDAGDGAVLWQTAVTPGVIGGVTVANGVAYFATTDGVLYALAIEDGRTLLTRKVGDSTAGGVTVAGGMVLLGWGWDWANGHQGGLVAYGLP